MVVDISITSENDSGNFYQASSCPLFPSSYSQTVHINTSLAVFVCLFVLFFFTLSVSLCLSVSLSLSLSLSLTRTHTHTHAHTQHETMSDFYYRHYFSSVTFFFQRTS